MFGGNKEDKALKGALEHFRRIIEDEQFQLELIHPAMREIIEKCPAYDRDPKGTGAFGFAETNPVPVNGPIGELAYLSKLETAQGERILFHRIGAIGTIDVFEGVTFSGSNWFVLFMDFYHPRKSRATPDGFRITKEVGQFSGFNKFCKDFPYDFIEVKQSDESVLSLAYIAMSKVILQIQGRAYERPLAHKAKLDLIKARLTSFKL